MRRSVRDGSRPAKKWSAPPAGRWITGRGSPPPGRRAGVRPRSLLSGAPYGAASRRACGWPTGNASSRLPAERSSSSGLLSSSFAWVMAIRREGCFGGAWREAGVPSQWPCERDRGQTEFSRSRRSKPRSVGPAGSCSETEAPPGSLPMAMQPAARECGAWLMLAPEGRDELPEAGQTDHPRHRQQRVVGSRLERRIAETPHGLDDAFRGPMLVREIADRGGREQEDYAKDEGGRLHWD